MRPIPDHSTDLLYSPFPREDLVRVANAMGFSNIYYVTTATLAPERALFHSCVNNVQARLKCVSWDETLQGIYIADKADAIYANVKESFMEELDARAELLSARKASLAIFVERMQESCPSPWDEAAFAQQWPSADTERFPHRWQRKAIESFVAVQNNIAQGNWQPEAGWDAARVTRYWGERNLEYKLFRDVARTLVNAEIDTFPADELLTYVPAAERKVVFVTGPMGGGKSSFTRNYVQSLTEQERDQMIPHDADYLKIALARAAQKDGKILAYHGPEVQNESSNALYENVRKRHYYARNGEAAPNVVVNSIIAGSYEVEDGLEGGGSVVVHHISMSPADAYTACKKRAEHTIRLPDEDSTNWSCLAATRNLLDLFRYEGRPITVELYERTNAAPQPIGRMDIAAKRVEVDDMAAFLRLAERAKLHEDPVQAATLFVQALQARGCSIVLRDGQQQQAVLEAGGKLQLELGVDIRRLNTAVAPIQSLIHSTWLGARQLPSRGNATSQGL
jgi:hypothetical protein